MEPQTTSFTLLIPFSCIVNLQIGTKPTNVILTTLIYEVNNHIAVVHIELNSHVNVHI
jgi:hypothetical protein